MGEYVNSQQLRFDKSAVSCGLTEAHHIPDQTPPKLMFAIANNQYNKANPRPSAYVIWSDLCEKLVWYTCNNSTTS